jgi:hypothetical protein
VGGRVDEWMFIVIVGVSRTVLRLPLIVPLITFQRQAVPAFKNIAEFSSELSWEFQIEKLMLLWMFI